MSEKDISEINIIYSAKNEEIKIFGSKFVNKNKGICEIIIDNNEYELTEKYNAKSNQ